MISSMTCQSFQKLQQKKLDGSLSLKDLHAALMGMENGRAPGIDGLPVEFYKYVWSEVGKDLQEVWNGNF